jgi:hypothetical protein
MDKIWFCTDRMSSLWGPSKPNSPVTILSNHPSLLRGCLLEGEWGNPERRSGRSIAGGQDLNPRAGAQFWLSRDFTDGCHTWDPRCKAYDVLVRFSPVGCTLIQIAVTLSDMSDCLSLLSSRSMSYCIGWMVWRMIMLIIIMVITVLI